MKDLPVEFPEGLHLAAILAREDPCDALVSNKYSALGDLPANVKIGTSSLRRQCQIKGKFPEAEILSLRGNVNTRLAKLDAGDYDAIILAVAGLKRLGMAGRISQILAVTDSLPAIGQGAIGIECRTKDRYINNILSALHDRDTALLITAERAMNTRLQGGCQVPIAGFAELQENRIYLRGLVGSPDGRQIIRAERMDELDQAEDIGFVVADKLLAQGADKILKDVYSSR
jgi:hydroxymethylbilane synthase